MTSNKEVLTIHEVRRDLEKALEFTSDLNKEYLDTGTVDTYKLRSVFAYLTEVNSCKWTNETF